MSQDTKVGLVKTQVKLELSNAGKCQHKRCSEMSSFMGYLVKLALVNNLTEKSSQKIDILYIAPIVDHHQNLYTCL